MKNIFFSLSRNGAILTLAVVGLTIGYFVGLTPETTARSASAAQVCPNSASCNGSNCTNKENCRKTGCGCGCVKY